MNTEQKIREVLELPHGKEILKALSSLQDTNTSSKGTTLDLKNPLHRELVKALRIFVS